MDEQQVKSNIASYLRTELSLVDREHLTVQTGEISIPVGDEHYYQSDVVVYDGAIPMFAVECKGDWDIRKAIGQAMVYRQAGIAAGVAGVDIPDEQQDAIIDSQLYGFNVVGTQVRELPNPDLSHAVTISDVQDKRIAILEEKLERTRELLD